MLEFVQTSPLARLVLYGFLVAVLLVVGVYLIRKVRPGDADDDSPTNEMMSTFRQLHSQGGLSDEEYRTIRTKLTARMHQEVKEDNTTGNSEET